MDQTRSPSRLTDHGLNAGRRGLLHRGAKAWFKDNEGTGVRDASGCSNGRRLQSLGRCPDQNRVGASVTPSSPCHGSPGAAGRHLDQARAGIPKNLYRPRRRQERRHDGHRASDYGGSRTPRSGPVKNNVGASANNPSDEALIAGMVLGDETATVTFVRRYQRRVFGLALGMLGDPAIAEDVSQEALIRAWRHAPVFDARRGSVNAWVLTITRNLAIDAIRKHRALPTDPDDIVALGLASGSRSPEDLGCGDQLAPELRAALNALPLPQRRAVVLAALYGRSIEEISCSESIPPGTAKTRIRAGLKKLRAALHNAEEWR
jgi:RNA polymerase sigma factor (sigma-70 family)